MKKLALKVTRVVLTWSLDLWKLADEHVFYLETGKTLEQAKADAKREIMQLFNVPAHDAKEMFLRQHGGASKKTGIN